MRLPSGPWLAAAGSRKGGGSAPSPERHLAAALDLVGPLAAFEARSEEGDVGGGGEG